MTELEQIKEPKKKSENKAIRLPKEPLSRFYNNDEQKRFELSIDEAGRGCLFGRVYVGCVVLPKDPALFDGKNIKDSKRFSSKKKINEVADYIKTNALAWHVSYVEADVIDDINILRAVMQGMHDSIKNILDKLGGVQVSQCMAIVDGNYFTPYRVFENVSGTICEMPHVTVEQGDGKYMAIAAASILAKTERDNYILELCQKQPDLVTRYHLDTNMGYGTKSHLNGIKEHGITQWHRKTFGQACKEAAYRPI
jgi:ribonuclease HII